MFKLHQFFRRNKVPAIFTLLLFIAGISFLASRITLEEDITSLIPSGEKQELLKKILDQTEFADKIIVTISSTSAEPNAEEMVQYAESFLDSVQNQLPEYVENIEGKVPEEGVREIYNFVYENLPLFLTEEDYREISTRLPEDSLQQKLRENYKNLISPTGLLTKEFLFKDPLSVTNLGLNKLEELQVGDDFTLYNNFLFTRDHKNLLLFISPAFPASETDRNSHFVEELTAIQDNLNTSFPGVKGEFFGGVLYSVANAEQIKEDIRITMSIAATILLLLLIVYYRKVYVPLLLFMPGLIGGITALAVLYLLKGSISAISLGIGAILLGISIDYSLHILTHYKNNKDVARLYRDVLGPVLMSSITTGVAFLCLMFVQSEALNDLGIFAAISVITASVFALFLIPLLYNSPGAGTGEKKSFLDRFAAYDFHKNKPLRLILMVLFLGGLFFFTKVEFNNNLSALNYAPEEIKEKEEKVEAIAGKAAKSLYLVSYGNTVDEALEINNDLYRDLRFLKEEGELNSFSSIGGVVLSTSTQLNKIEQWQEFWTPERREQLQEDLINNSGELGFKPESFEDFYELLSKDFDPIYLEDYQNTATLHLNDFITEGEDFATVSTSINVAPENLLEVLEEVKKNEQVVVVDRQQINEGFLGNLKSDFNVLIGYSLLAVFLILMIFYRSIELTLLTLIPVGVTWVIALGIMAVLDLEFNILNIIISTFIFGLGLDYSIFITNAFLKEYESGVNVLNTYRTSILLSVITTFLGIGTLLFAQHPALRSISIVSVIGVISAFLVAFVFQAYSLQVLFLNRTKKGRPAFSFRGLLTETGYKGGKAALYHKNDVLENYRYKKVYSQVKKQFEKEKERYLKLAEFLEEKDQILIVNSGYGLLPIFLHYKNQKVQITGLEKNEEAILISQNSFAANSEKLNFSNELPAKTNFDSFIISEEPSLEVKNKLENLIKSKAKKVIILDPDYSFRWIIDINFEIIYRQNNIVLLRKME